MRTMRNVDVEEKRQEAIESCWKAQDRALNEYLGGLKREWRSLQTKHHLNLDQFGVRNETELISELEDSGPTSGPLWKSFGRINLRASKEFRQAIESMRKKWLAARDAASEEYRRVESSLWDTCKVQRLRFEEKREYTTF